jgi:glycosyltransferase involved in cell wall biosynthesis
LCSNAGVWQRNVCSIMKILLLTPWYPDEESKHGVFVQEQARALAKLHSVMVVSTKINYKESGVFSFTMNEFRDGLLVEQRIRIKSSFRIFNQLNYFITNFYLTLLIARKFKPDLIHGNIGYPGALWSYLVGRATGKPFIITEHTFIYNNFRSQLHKMLTLFALKRASAVLTVSNKAAAEIKKYNVLKVKVVPNIVRVGMFDIQPFPPGIITMGFMGNLSSPIHVKGLDVLLRVLARVRLDFRLLIGGEGSRMEEYKLQATTLGIGEKCFFYGFFPYERGPEFMRQLHFFVNTSRQESFGIALVESMASGIPVVCFDNGGPSDFVQECNGILVENQNEEKLLVAIEWMMQHYQTYDREKIRASVSRQFTEDAFINRMKVIYEEIAR